MLDGDVVAPVGELGVGQALGRCSAPGGRRRRGPAAAPGAFGVPAGGPGGDERRRARPGGPGARRAASRPRRRGPARRPARARRRRRCRRWRPNGRRPRPGRRRGAPSPARVAPGPKSRPLTSASSRAGDMQVQRGLGLGQVEVLALAGAAPVLQRGQHGGQAEAGRDDVGVGAERSGRRPAGPAGGEWKPNSAVVRLPSPASRSVTGLAGQAARQQDDARVDRRHAVVAEAHAGQRAGREALDDHVRPADQVEQTTSRPPASTGRARGRACRRWCWRAARCPRGGAGRGGGGGARTVRATSDPLRVSTARRWRRSRPGSGRRRARHRPGEVEHLETLERQGAEPRRRLGRPGDRRRRRLGGRPAGHAGRPASTASARRAGAPRRASAAARRRRPTKRPG